ncbi:hypothetical protein E2C01_007926 [Portunus trituberculatus]|uniref:Uncharacterized protein n=1 Tax=Portunus trituberculatus TaxID=210409 RepID=A0A5B7D2J1_PORTR|nr:hypothetical protein [Portunus trituberculatus]
MLPCPVGSVGARGTHARRSLLVFDRRLLSTPKAALLENTPLTTPNTYCVPRHTVCEHRYVHGGHTSVPSIILTVRSRDALPSRLLSTLTERKILLCKLVKTCYGPGVAGPLAVFRADHSGCYKSQAEQWCKRQAIRVTSENRLRGRGWENTDARHRRADPASHSLAQPPSQHHSLSHAIHQPGLDSPGLNNHHSGTHTPTHAHTRTYYMMVLTANQADNMTSPFRQRRDHAGC